MPTANLYIKEGIGGTMQTYIVERTDDSVTLAFKDANLTLITPLMKELYGPAKPLILDKLKKELDPNNIMNPGKMGFGF